MEIIFFKLFYGFTWLIAKIPMFITHGIADFSYIILYYLARYRRSVVRRNLTNSFPTKTLKEIRQIERAFYRHLSDMFFEDFFLLHASKEEAMKKCKFNNLDIFNELYSEGKSAILVSGHYGNWEHFAQIGHQVKHVSLGIYKPLVNQRFDALMNNFRKRFGGTPVPMNDTLRAIIDCNQKGQPFLLGLVSDQTPPGKEIQYWTQFLNQDTAMYLGIEKIAQKFDLPIYFCEMKKTRRGIYEINIELLADSPKTFKKFELTNLHTKRLEKMIQEEPELWLWSHKRWKRKRKPEVSNTHS